MSDTRGLSPAGVSTLESKGDDLDFMKPANHSTFTAEDLMPELAQLLALSVDEWEGSSSLTGFIGKMAGRCGAVDLDSPCGAFYADIYPLWCKYCRKYPEVVGLVLINLRFRVSLAINRKTCLEV